MARQLVELEALMAHMVVEHRKLLGHLEAHQAAMKKMDTRQMEAAAKLQDATRIRIANLEARRRVVARESAMILKLPQGATLSQIADAWPAGKQKLLASRTELRAIAQKVASRATVASRLAGAILGHLNTIVRLVAGAVEQAGLYTSTGAPRVGARVGVMDAVG